MERLKGIAVFGVWLLGLSYLGMWAVTGPLEKAAAISVHPEDLSPALHVAGGIAALVVCVRLVSAALRGEQGAPPDGSQRLRRRPRRPEPTVTRIKGRDHFGLRGVHQ